MVEVRNDENMRVFREVLISRISGDMKLLICEIL